MQLTISISYFYLSRILFQDELFDEILEIKYGDMRSSFLPLLIFLEFDTVFIR